MADKLKISKLSVGDVSGRWDYVSSDAGTAWATIQKVLRERHWGGGDVDR